MNYNTPQRDIDTGPGGGKVRRYRKPWVYKSDYDQLSVKYSRLQTLCWLLLVAFIVALKFALQ